MTGTVVIFAVGAAVAATEAAAVPVMAVFNAVVVGLNITRHVPVFAISVGASDGFPTLNIARLERQAVSNFALFEFDRPKGTLGAVTILAEGTVDTFVSRIM